jgi:tRNA (guanine-N7-)-methyltransferase
MAQYGLSVDDGMIECEDAILEIGFGMGASLLELVKKNPEQQYIGVEVHQPGVGRLLMGVQEAECDNLRVYRHDVNDVLNHCIPDHSLKGIYIFFPDPWHKKKHNKRRLIQPEFIETLSKKIKLGGVLHIATDWEDYANHIQSVLDGQDNFSLTTSKGDRPNTKYEARGQRLGHEVWDFVYTNN